MPPEAKVAIFGQDPGSLPLYRTSLELSHHKVVGSATRLEGYDKLLPQLGQLGVEVILVDEGLSSRDGSRHLLGHHIAKEIKSRYPEIKIVGIPTVGIVVGADENLSKLRMIGQKKDIGELVTSL